MSDWIDRFLQLTENTEPPKQFRLWVAISTIAACLKRKCYIQWEGNLYPNMYIMLVAPAGRARKGTAMRYGRMFLESIGIKIAAESTTREALIRDLNESLEIQTDGAMVIKHHRSLTIYNEEIAVLFNKNDSRMVRDLIDWFDCKDVWNYRTKDQKKSDLMNNIFVNLCGAIQPETLHDVMPRETISGGLASRFIFVYEYDKGKVVPIPLPLNQTLFDEMQNELHEISMMEGEFKTTESFIHKMIDWVEEHESNPPFSGTLLESYSSRRRVHILKLCMIYNTARTRNKILDVQDFDKALETLVETEGKMLLAFSGVGKSDIAQIVPQVMRSIMSAGKISFSKLLNTYHHDADKETLMKIISNLKAMRKVRIVDSSDKGDFDIEYVFKEKKT